MADFVNYNKRSIDLPPGCKDLVDVLKLEAGAMSDATMTSDDKELRITIRISSLSPGDLGITVEGCQLRVRIRRPGSKPWESVLEVPPGFDVARASAAFFNGELRITVPKFQGSAIV